LDIWVTRFENGLWQVPENLGAEINTPFDETAPFIAPDNKTLYFTSNGHPGLGGNDIFYTRKQENGKWAEPQNLGFPLNTPYDDVSLVLSADGQKAYFASDRPGGYGSMDIYEVEIPEKFKPVPATFVYGIVYDSITKDRLTYAQMEWYDAETGEPAYHYQSNRGDASFMSAMLLNKTYHLKVVRYGYSDYSDTIVYTTPHIAAADTMNIALLPSHYVPPLHDTLLFRYNFVTYQVDIPDSALKIVGELLQPYLTGNEHTTFFVNGHSDSIGRPESNEMYSYQRARSLTDYLRKALGIEGHRITVRGWADAHPVVDNGTEENRFLNRRVELVVRKPE